MDIKVGECQTRIPRLKQELDQVTVLAGRLLIWSRLLFNYV